MKKTALFFILVMAFAVGGTAYGSGNKVTSDLWINAIINTVEKGQIEAVWQKGGDAYTFRGDRVIWGYFYASPSDVTWGSQNNPDLFVKIWFDVNGRVDVNFFHVSVPDIDVYSDYPYQGTADEHDVATTSKRYIRHYYEKSVSQSSVTYEDGNPASGYYPAADPAGNITSNNLKIGAMINTVEKGLIEAVWQKGGEGATSRGDKVIWGHFYANPSDVSWGGLNNPDLFVKIWFDVNGRVDVNYFHVSVPDIEVYSDLPAEGSYSQKGTTILTDRYIRHEFNIDPSSNNDDAVVLFGTGNKGFTVGDEEQYDAMSGFRSGIAMEYDLPSQTDYSSKVPAVKSQDCTGSCTSWSVGYYLKSYQEVVEEGWDKNKNAFSPMYLWAMQCRSHFDNAEYNPANIITAWRVLNNYGCAKYETMPFEYFCDRSFEREMQKYADVSISSGIKAEAMKYKSGSYVPLYSLDEIKGELAKNGPVVLGINRYSSDAPTSNWNPSPENNYLSYDPDNIEGGHAVLCVGYNDSKFGGGALKFVNSWGEDWGPEGGYCWIRYSDVKKIGEGQIVVVALAIIDSKNVKEKTPTAKKPDSPTNVSASDAIGTYVDITWTKTDTALFYKIYRVKVGDTSTYEAIGVSYSGSYRDDSVEPKVEYYYSAVSVNDIGESDHYASDKDDKAYVDKGSAKGQSLIKPVVKWTGNNDNEIRSYFEASNMDPAATAMEVFVSTTNKGPWSSFGWVNPGDFHITWGENSEYVGTTPFVLVKVANTSAYSYSDPVQVKQTIVTRVPVAIIKTFTATADEDSITLSWTTDGGKVDFYEIWRKLASSEDNESEWVLHDNNVAPDWTSGVDSKALPGKAYYYAIRAVYQGTQSEFKITDEPVKIIVKQANLYLYNINYNYDMVINPAEFEIEVWNDGDVAITDYAIKIKAYDWNDGKVYAMITFKASDVDWDGDLLPLKAGYRHILSFTYNIPPEYADGHYYSWGIEIDPNNEISELYEDDNLLWSDESWWFFNSNSRSSGDIKILQKITDVPVMNSKCGNARAFNEKCECTDSRLRCKEERIGPIRYKKPSFCIKY